MPTGTKIVALIPIEVDKIVDRIWKFKNARTKIRREENWEGKRLGFLFHSHNPSQYSEPAYL